MSFLYWFPWQPISLNGFWKICSMFYQIWLKNERNSNVFQYHDGLFNIGENNKPVAMATADLEETQNVVVLFSHHSLFSLNLF